MPKIPQDYFDELGPQRTAGMWAAPKAHGRMPEQTYDASPARLNAALRLLRATIAPGGFIADLGCLYGAYAIAFAKAGYYADGIDIRQTNIAMAKQAAREARLGIRAAFWVDNVWNLDNYKTWDAIWCCGLLYHLDRPVEFIQLMARHTRKLLIVQTHISVRGGATNEGAQGHWYAEGDLNHPFSAHGNVQSFWLTRSSLIQALQEAGFPLVMEVHDQQADIKGSPDRVMFAAIRE